MDRTSATNDSPNNLGLQKLQNDALPQPEKPDSKGIVGLAGEVIHTAAYTGIQEPVTGVSQIIDKFAGTKLASNLQFISAPEHAKFGSADWHAQQVGGAVGMLVPFLATRAGARSLMGVEETGLMTSRAAFNMNMKEAALTGFAYDAILRPSQTPQDASVGQFLLDRGTQGAIGAGTFMTMTATGLGLKNLAGSSAIERSALVPILKNPIAAGALSGLPAGLFNAEANSLAKTGQHASLTELGQSAYAMTFMGGGFGLAHSIKSSDFMSSRTSNSDAPVRVKEGLSLASGDTVTPEGAKFSVAPESLRLEIKQPTMTELSKRITGFESVVEPLAVPKDGAPATFETHADFLRNNVEFKDTPMRSYSVEGHTTKILVPETYAAQLDAVRQFRLGLEGVQPKGPQPIEPGLLHRALPEDFIPHLDSLPNKGLVKKLYIVNEADPMNPIYAKDSGNPLFEAQASTSDGAITFFRKNTDRYLGDELRHEWSHLARNSLPIESSTFDLAAKHEGKKYIPRERALDDPEEYWSVLNGEEMLSPEPARFNELVQKAPLQSVAMAEGMKSTIAAAEDARIAVDPVIKARIDYIDGTVKPKVVEQLVTDAKTGGVNDFGKTAAKLLIRLGEGQRLNEIPGLKELNLSNEPVGASTLSALSGNKTIESLDLSRTYAGPSGFSYLEQLPLRELSLAGTKTTGSSLDSLQRIKTLESLDLSSTEVNDSGVTSLRRMQQLKRIDLSNTNASSEAIDWLREQMPNTVIEY